RVGHSLVRKKRRDASTPQTGQLTARGGRERSHLQAVERLHRAFDVGQSLRGLLALNGDAPLEQVGKRRRLRNRDLAETTGGSLSLLEETAPGLTPRGLQGSCRQRATAAHVEQLNGEHRETERDRWIGHVVPASAQAVPGATTVAGVEADEA